MGVALADPADIGRLKSDRGRLIEALEAAGARIRGNAVNCPFHDDKTPSGSIHERNGKGWRFTCHGCVWNANSGSGDIFAVVKKFHGCDFATACDVLGIGSDGPPVVALTGRKGTTRTDDTPKNGRGDPPRTFESVEAFAATLGNRHGGTWVYEHTDGTPAMAVIRVNKPDGGKKEKVLPFHPVPGGWAIGDPPGPWPLYLLPELSSTGRVFVCEGEKCVEAARSIGLSAVTSPHGAKAAAKTDWSPLAHRDATILPDNDQAGRGYANDVAQILRDLGCTVRIVELPGLPAGGDIVDYIQAKDSVDSDDICRGIKEMADATPIADAGDMKAHTDDQEADCEDRIRTRRMSEIEPEEITYLWPGRMAIGKLSLIVGDPGLGKSFCLIDVAGRISKGTPWPDQRDTTNQRGTVFILSAEDCPEDTIRPRLDACQADVTQIHVIDGVERGDCSADDPVDMVSLARDLRHVEAAIAQHKDARLLIVDPLSAYLGSGVDGHKDSDVRRVLSPLVAMATRTRIAVIGIMHLRKAASISAVHRAIGSVAFVAAARAVWLVAKDQEDPERRLLLQVKNNLARDPGGLAFRISEPGVIHWDAKSVTVTADEVLSQPAQHNRTARDDAIDWLTQTLAIGPVEATKIQEAAKADGFAWRTVRRAKDELKIRSKPKGHGREMRWYWELPFGVDDPDVPP